MELLKGASLVKVINIENNETRYDSKVHNHGHFKCESCGTIYDFEVDIDNLVVKSLEYFKINDKNIYFKGICAKCQEKNKN